MSIKIKKNTVIIGAGGNASKIIEILENYNITLVGYISTEKKGTIIGEKPVIGSIEEIEILRKSYKIDSAIISLGDNYIRKRLTQPVVDCNINLINSIHSKSIISKSVTIGSGNMIMAGSIIQPHVGIGDGCLIDSNSVLEHESKIGDFSSIGPGAVLCGKVIVGSVTSIGAGATILEKSKVGDHCVIGAGSVVNRQIPDFSLAYGVPVRVIRGRQKGEVYLR